MPRRCLIEAAHRRLPATLDDGSLAGLRRRLVERASGRVLDLSPHWEDNLPAYRADRVRSIDVPAARTVAPPAGVPAPQVRPSAGVGDPGEAGGPWDTVIAVFTLCGADDPAGLLAWAHRGLSPGGRILTFDHVAGTGLAAAAQRLAAAAERSLGVGCRPGLDVIAAAESAGLAAGDCARLRLWVGAAVPVPGVATTLRPRRRPGDGVVAGDAAVGAR